MFLALAICVAVLNACIVNILMTARFIFSTGRDLVWGEWFRTPLVSIQTSQDTPWGATLGVGTLGVLACWLPIQVLTVVTGTGLVFIYFILCVCIIVGRINNKSTTSTGNLEFRPAINPVFAIVGMLALLGIVVTNWLDPATGRPSVIAALVEAAVGVLLYILRRFVFGQKIQIVIPE
jgi:amino acid transporter